MGTPNREPQEYGRNIIVYKDPGRYIPIIFLLYSWGSLFEVPINVPLNFGQRSKLPSYRLRNAVKLGSVNPCPRAAML